ncbi:MAG TPA: DUF4012 domain-containing protein [Nocardioides sp.]|nr:DUF4012 domain-containing protein [Nocardioides sp.]
MSPEVRRRRSRRSRAVRRLKSQVREHPRAAVAIAVLVVLLLAGGWGAWRAVTIAHDLDRAARNAEILEAALERGDVPGARLALRHFQSAVDDADAKSSGPTWAVAEHLPFVGDDAAGVATMSSVLADIGRRGVPPVVGAADQVTGDAFQPKGHRFPLDRIVAMQRPARESEQAFAAADARLATVDSNGFVGSLRVRFDALRNIVSAAHATLGSTYRAARMMPDLLGADGPRSYVLVMENNAELRSLGGLAGSLSLVHADHGTVHIISQDDMADLARNPRIRLTHDEKQLFGDLLKLTGVNATMTPDAPRAAELVRKRWIADHGGRVDGVFFVDPVAVSYLLQGLGTVPVAGYPPVTWTNVVQQVENQIYLDTGDRNQQSDFQNAVARSVFNAFADGRGDPLTAIRGLVRAVGEGRVRMRFFRPADQAQVAGTAIAGQFPTRPTLNPQAGVYVNDSTESKMSYYLRYDASLVARSCGAGIQDAAGSVTLTNAAPADIAHYPVSVTGLPDPARGIRKGQQFVVVYLTSPIDGAITSLSIDGREVADPALVTFDGRQVAGVGVNISPGASHTLSWVMRSGVRQSGAWQLAVTPGSAPGTESETVPSAC